MTTATRRLEFDAAHRVLGHGGKCKYLHGHRYVVEVTVQSEELNSLGMVVDFSCIKEKVGKWIDEELDHNVLLHKDDPLLLGYFYTDDETTPTGIDREPFVMRCNPTAENIAQMIYDKAYELLESYRARVIRVRVFETPNCWADYPG